MLILELYIPTETSTTLFNIIQNQLDSNLSIFFRNDIQDQLREMIQFLDDLEMQREQMIKDEDERDLLTKQMATVHEVESLGAAMSSHPINTLSQRYSVYRKCLEELENAKELLIDTYRESIDDKRTYLTTISDDYEANLNDMKITLNNLLQIEMPSEFEFVKDLLKNSAQEAMYLQADQARKELDASLVQQSFFIKVGLDALLQYNNVVSYLPQREVEKQRWFQYERWSQNAIEDPESSDDVLRELDEALEEERTRANAANILKYAYELENMWIDATFSIRQQYETLHGQLTDSSVSISFDIGFTGCMLGIEIFPFQTEDMVLSTVIALYGLVSSVACSMPSSNILIFISFIFESLLQF